MYLFLHQTQLYCLRQTFLYIPQCIYFYCCQPSPTFTFLNLYIPQCIYFYENDCIAFCNENTLHSTMYLFLRWLLYMRVWPCNIFTFHNVSISTRPIFSLSNTVITSPVLSTSFLISILSQIYTCDNIHFTYHAL